MKAEIEALQKARFDSHMKLTRQYHRVILRLSHECVFPPQELATHMKQALSKGSVTQSFDSANDADALDDLIFEKSKALRDARKTGKLSEDEEVDAMEEIADLKEQLSELHRGALTKVKKKGRAAMSDDDILKAATNLDAQAELIPHPLTLCDS